MTLFSKNNKSIVKKGRFTTPISCCPDPSPCCDDGGNDPRPPTNCAWRITVDDGTEVLLNDFVPNNTLSALFLADLVTDSVLELTFTVRTLSSPVDEITVLTSGATGLDGASTYVGSTPVVPTATSATAGVLSLDTSVVGVFQASIEIETNCGTYTTVVNYTVADALCNFSYTLFENSSEIITLNGPLNPAYILNGGTVTQNSLSVIDIQINAITAITVLTSGATGLNGASTYIGVTPGLSPGGQVIVGTLNLDTSVLGLFSSVVNITTSCSNIQITVFYNVVV